LIVQKFYQAKNNGFYSELMHGTRTIWVPAPDWVRPTKDVPAMSTDGDDSVESTIKVPDLDAVAPLIEVPNPACTLPPEGDLVEISEEIYNAMFAGQAAGKEIQAGKDGYPVLVDPPPLTAEQLTSVALTRRDGLLTFAALRIAPLQSAVDLDDATASDIANLKKWKQYQVALNRIQDQPAFPQDVAWPVEPS
jgi:hypothetical protein